MLLPDFDCTVVEVEFADVRECPLIGIHFCLMRGNAESVFDLSGVGWLLLVKAQIGAVLFHDVVRVQG